MRGGDERPRKTSGERNGQGANRKLRPARLAPALHSTTGRGKAHEYVV